MQPPLTSSTWNSTCSPDHISRWQPYTNSNNFQGGEHHPWRFGDGSHLPRTQQELGGRKPVSEAGTSRMVAAPTVVYSAGMKLAGAEVGERECAICLSEFEEGDGIQVLAKCKHGFHVQCIQRWLASNFSCPTCRCSCLPPSLISEETTHRCTHYGSQPGMPD
ncbi:Actin 7 isoform 1 [Hibiscus syriacus]|uniref:RING-type E3 ubiquitin transferase n=1 Tax=Hibiscus syriacus TaxID=106335 RepID=A0A6A2Y084_HIBSY|nr:Actin 7 isoform 1 [Hibiscus syriacus]